MSPVYDRDLYAAAMQRLDDRFEGELIPIKQAAAYVGCDPRTIQSLKGVKKMGRFYYLPKVWLARWMAS